MGCVRVTFLRSGFIYIFLSLGMWEESAMD